MPLSTLFRWLRPQSPRIARPIAARRTRLLLESLEDRLAPAVLTVDTLADLPVGNTANVLSLREAITVVDQGRTTGLSAGELGQIAGTLGQNDTIVFADELAGTIGLTAALPTIFTNLQILGPGPDQLTISGGAAYQIFLVATSAGQVSIAGLTLADGNASAGNTEVLLYGGALDVGVAGNGNTPPTGGPGVATDVNVNNCVFANNQAFIGGGAVDFQLNSGSLTVSNSRFNNDSTSSGGAIFCDCPSLLLRNDSFTSNRAANSGGAVSSSAFTTVQNCAFTGNSATGGNTRTGGAIDINSGAALTVMSSTFTDNTAGTFGGAVFDDNAPLAVFASSFADNVVGTTNTPGEGGAIYSLASFGQFSGQISGSTFTANAAQGNSNVSGNGGALYLNGEITELTNDTIAFNGSIDGTSVGGGIYVSLGTAVTLFNTIVAGNITGDIAGAVSSGSANNLIGDPNTAGGLQGTNGNLIGAQPDLLPLGNYGGPTLTMPPAPNSPAVGAGSSAYVTDQATDQRGFSRMSSRGNVDIGAVQLQPAGTATHLELQGPSTADVGATMAWTATALDDNGVPAVNFSGPILMSVAAGPWTFTNTSTTSADAVYGTAVFNNLTLDTPGAYSIQAGFGNSLVTAPLAVLGQIVLTAQLRIPLFAGNELGLIEAAVETPAGTVVAGDSDPVTLALLAKDTSNQGGGTSFIPTPFATGSESVTEPAQDGTAIFSGLAVNGANAVSSTFTQNYVLRATAGDATADSTAFTVHPAAPRQLAFFEQPTTTTAGQPISPPVTMWVEDTYDNLVTTNNSRVTITATNSAGGSPVTFGVAAVNGRATFSNIKLATPGTYTLTASDGTLTPATSVSFTVLPADPLVGPALSAVVGTRYRTALYALVTDAAGTKPLAGVPVTFTAPATGPSGTFAGWRSVTVRTNAAGIATAPVFTANARAGSFAVTVSFGGIAAPETIALTNLPGAPARLIVSPAQSAVSGDLYAQPLTARVTDVYGNAIAGVTVTFTAPANAADGTFADQQRTVTAVTNTAGVAPAPAFTAGTAIGRFYVDVFADGLAGVIALTNRRAS